MLNSREMTLQDVFNVVWERAKNPVKSRLGDLGICAYRGSNGLKCFIGECIADEDYKADMEGGTSASTAIQKLFPKISEHAGMRRIQMVHDCEPVEEWETDLRSIARYRNLTIPE
jgi:hypothetical protein